MIRAVRLISFSVNPLDVTTSVPIRMPLVTPAAACSCEPSYRGMGRVSFAKVKNETGSGMIIKKSKTFRRRFRRISPFVPGRDKNGYSGNSRAMALPIAT